MASKLSLAKLDKIIKSEQYAPVTTIKYEIDGVPVEIAVKKYIDFGDMLGLVNGVVESVFDIDKDGQEHYLPELLDYAMSQHFIEYFTNLKIELGASRVFSLVYGTEIMENIAAEISKKQVSHIAKAVDSAVSHRLAMIISGERAKLVDATKKIEEASNALVVISEQFSGIGDDKLQAAFDNLAKLDGVQFVPAGVDARATQ